MLNSQAYEHLLELLMLELGRDKGYDEFRREYEHIFNFELDKASVSEHDFGGSPALTDAQASSSPLTSAPTSFGISRASSGRPSRALKDSGIGTAIPIFS
jgi:hypothetical protein